MHLVFADPPDRCMKKFTTGQAIRVKVNTLLTHDVCTCAFRPFRTRRAGDAASVCGPLQVLYDQQLGGDPSCNVVTGRCRGRHTDREAPPIPPPWRQCRRLWCLATRCPGSTLPDPPPASLPAGPPASPLAGPPAGPPASPPASPAASPPTSPLAYHLPRHQEALGRLPPSAKPISSRIQSFNGRSFPQSHRKARG